MITTILALLMLSRAPTPAHYGRATYYTMSSNGGTVTASGEPLDDDALTTAHRTLPFGTRVRLCRAVRATRNGALIWRYPSVTVTVTDRGPVSRRLEFDLSRAAMARLYGLDAGVVDVRWRVL